LHAPLLYKKEEKKQNNKTTKTKKSWNVWQLHIGMAGSQEVKF
jgi:hypothetical protein